MSSGAELNHLLMPRKFGAGLCAAATANGVVSPLIPVLAVPIMQSAITEADVASDRIVMGIFVVECGVV